MKKMRTNACVLLGVLLLTGCDKEKQGPEVKTSLSISPVLERVDFSAAGTERYDFRVRSSQTLWSAFSDQLWCKVKIDANHNDFTIYAEPNTTTTPATATITVSAGNAKPITITATQAAAEPQYDIYMAGGYTLKGDLKKYICCWKNGVGERFDTNGRQSVECTSITESNGSIYIAGTIGTDPGYWKDGQRFNLPSLYYITKSIAVDGEKVYVLGTHYYWAGSETVLLNNDEFNGKDIVVSAGSVRVAGDLNLPETGNGITVASWWENGVATPLSSPVATGESRCTCAAASDGSMYIGGYYLNQNGQQIPCYWKDEACTPLNLPQGGGSGQVLAICVRNGMVYAAGKTDADNPICYWANGIRRALDLPDGISFATVSGIAIIDGTIYVSGYYTDNNGVHVCYWKDGKRTVVETGLEDAAVCGIAAVNK